jgi:hypothetical protein
MTRRKIAPRGLDLALTEREEPETREHVGANHLALQGCGASPQVGLGRLQERDVLLIRAAGKIHILDQVERLSQGFAARVGQNSRE